MCLQHKGNRWHQPCHRPALPSMWETRQQHLAPYHLQGHILAKVLQGLRSTTAKLLAVQQDAGHRQICKEQTALCQHCV